MTEQQAGPTGPQSPGHQGSPAGSAAGSPPGSTPGHFPGEGMVDFDTEVEDTPHASGQGGGGDAASSAGSAEEEPIDQRIGELTADLQRLQAEYVNYKKRVDRDRELVQQNARFTILSALLPVLDDVDRARGHGELEGGFKAVAESLERIVTSQGLTKYGEPGDEFDPRIHEALMHGHSAEVTTSTCQNIVQAGYLIGDRVVRPAMVTVVDPEPESQAPAEPEPATPPVEPASE